MKGVILAGGSGTRLQPITHTTQKQLVPLVNKPVIQHVIENLMSVGVTDIGVVIGGKFPGDIKEFLGFLDNYEDVLGHMRAANIFVSPSTREGFGITFIEAMAADCTVIAADHPDSAADEVIDDAGFLVNPTIESLSRKLKSALEGECPPMNPVERAQRYDWNAVAKRAEAAYRRAVNGTW